MTSRALAWMVTALAMAAGALSSDPPETWEPSPEIKSLIVKLLQVITWNRRFHKFLFRYLFKTHLNRVLFQPGDSGHGRPPGERSRLGQESILTECNEHKCGKAKIWNEEKKILETYQTLLLLLLIWKRFNFYFFGGEVSFQILRPYQQEYITF